MSSATSVPITIEEVLRLKVLRRQQFYATSSTATARTFTSKSETISSSLTIALQIVGLISLVIVTLTIILIVIKCCFQNYFKKKPAEGQIRATVQRESIEAQIGTKKTPKNELDSISIVMC